MYLDPGDSGDPIVPFMELSVPAIDVASVVPVNITDFLYVIQNLAAYTNFSSVLLASETVNIGIRSTPRLYVGAVNFDVNYQKVITLNGRYNNFRCNPKIFRLYNINICPLCRL